MENTKDLWLFLHLSNTGTSWCLLWCTEVKLDCLSLSTALYNPGEQFCQPQVARTVYAVLCQLCLPAGHPPSTWGYECLEHAHPLNPPIPRKCHSEVVKKIRQAWIRPRRFALASSVVLLSVLTASKKTSLKTRPEEWDERPAGTG